ncbi:MAG: DUF2513 domain-containing protein [Lachnospiraceae bacterium]|nr:DUF2513 domain-containing protein [Lachnospiraceae bacterium]
MKLDIDCLRDVLICVEDNTGLHQPCVFYDVPVMEKSCSLLEKEKPDIPGYQAELIEKYKGSDIVFYHVLQCVEGGLISRVEDTAPYEAVISGLTFEGHDFLGNMRNPKIMKWISKVAEEAGGMGIKTLLTYVGSQLPATLPVILNNLHF